MSLRSEVAATSPLEGGFLGLAPGVVGIFVMINGLTVSTALTHVM